MGGEAEALEAGVTEAYDPSVRDDLPVPGEAKDLVLM